MNHITRGRVVGILFVLGCFTMQADTRAESRCKKVHGELIEESSTVGCKPEHPNCFLGEVDGNQGLRGTTYFRGDSSAPGPSTSPGFVIYSGQFEYTTGRGMLIMRETGVVERVQPDQQRRAVTAYQKIVDATGDFAGATGHLFVSGFITGGHIETEIFGEICHP